ncbi:hypothetical protein J6590_077949 [Homalodisca vitripennis]|nr:hypothetical protein J6590_077949 [Homalodisca vitripennis]
MRYLLLHLVQFLCAIFLSDSIFRMGKFVGRGRLLPRSHVSISVRSPWRNRRPDTTRQNLSLTEFESCPLNGLANF